MKIFGDELNPSIPYKTFLLSVKDTAEWIVKEMLEKYGLKHENAQKYCLLQVNISNLIRKICYSFKIVIPIQNEIIKEVILQDKECPLNIYLNHIQKHQG
jgi:afadin